MRYLLRPILVYKPKDLNRDWSPRFSTLRDKNGWIRATTAGNLNLVASRNRFCDFLADRGGRNFSRFLHQYWPEQVLPVQVDHLLIQVFDCRHGVADETPIFETPIFGVADFLNVLKAAVNPQAC
eukprot:COSAG06_NODE_172_length_21346_cov_503.127053_12_plen_125_part_00